MKQKDLVCITEQEMLTINGGGVLKEALTFLLKEFYKKRFYPRLF